MFFYAMFTKRLRIVDWIFMLNVYAKGG